MKILLSGDLHLGRASTGIGAPGGEEELRVTRAWMAMVALAIEQQVSAVCLSGDVVDQDNRFWEAVGPLEAGIRQLAEHDILTLTVAGNHDHQVLARLADELPPEHFRLLGRGGKWERFAITDADGSRIFVDGWSFPNSVVETDPLAKYDLSGDSSAPILGMVHGDLDSPTSRYAPLNRARMATLPPQAWHLGHIHAPRLLTDTNQPWVLYPGSPQALDAGERGVHGVWLTELRDGALREPRMLPLSSVAYDVCAIDLSAIDTLDAVESAIHAGLREHAADICTRSADRLLAIALRVELIGRTPLVRDVNGITAQQLSDVELSVDGITVSVDKIANRTLPAIDLAEHARSNTAAGALARLLIELDAPEPSEEVTALLRRAEQAARYADLATDFGTLERRDDSESYAASLVKTQARNLLAELIAQTS